MNRMRNAAALALILLLTAGAAGAQEWDKVQLQSVELGEGIWAIYGAGGNHVLAAGPADAVLVDTDYAEVSGKLLDIVVDLVGDAPLVIVDTHWHFDHVGGNLALREHGAFLIAHENVRSRMAAGAHLAVIDHDSEPAEPEALPVATFSDRLVLHRGDETVTITHVPNAHTSGDAFVFFEKANVLHTGDVVFYCGYPFIDINDGGTIDGMIAGVDTAIALCDEETQVVPGHGPLTDKAGLMTYRGVLQDFRDAVAAAKADGKSLEEVLASDVTAAVDADWDNKMFPSKDFKELVYRSLP